MAEHFNDILIPYPVNVDFHQVYYQFVIFLYEKFNNF
jgi:hypothetical protein